MGIRLVRYYEFVEEQLGRAGKVELARLTRIPSIIAAGQEETEEVLRQFREAVKQVTGKSAPN